MNDLRPLSALASASAQLRDLVLSVPEGTLLGSEEMLQAMLAVSRATVRQVARLLEREGLLRVRRGINGGYFAARPDVSTIETVVSAYLQMVNADCEDVTMVASALWSNAMRRAAALRTDEACALADRLRRKILAMPDRASFSDTARLDDEIRSAIFALIGSSYTELIFHINGAFARRRFPTLPGARDDTVEHRAFVRTWCNAKLMEIEAIASGDQDLAELAARHSRKVWHERLFAAEVE